MVRHSKNNTNSAKFTAHERSQLKQGTQSERLGRDSMKNFNACSLCLERARDPRVCAEGHIFCQECIINSLLSQKKDIKRQTLLLERIREDEADQLASARAAARERVLREFEQTQNGLASISGKVKAVPVELDKGKGKDEEAKGTKRKFDLDNEEIDRLTEEGLEVALRKTALEMAESRRAKLPNFWLPSLTPSSTPATIIDVKLQTLCNVTVPTHPCSLKSLLVVKFEEDATDTAPVGQRSCICGVCRKSFSNNVKAYVLKPCGDVVCTMCVETLCRPENQCAHCGTKVLSKGGFIELKREGTGFAAGGQAEAKRFDLAFQG